MNIQYNNLLLCVHGISSWSTPSETFSNLVLTVGLQCPWLTASASCLVNSLDNKNILGATLQAVHCVVVLLDVGNNHPALQGVAQT